MLIPVDSKLAIHELLARAAFGYDERDKPLLADCFANDASFTLRIAGGDLMGPFEGREAIMARMTSSMDSQNDVRRHVISNLFFAPTTDDQVDVVSYLTLLATEKGPSQTLSTGIYRDTVRQTNGQWRIEKRHLDLDSNY
jgi:hypothetical protein